MKQVLVIISLFLCAFGSAQPKYEGAMGKGLQQLKDAKSADDMTATAAFFERVGEAEKDKWLPYYYAAYANYLTGWMNPKADKDKVAEKTKELVTKAEALSPNNSELFCLRQMTAIQQMTVDPMTRYQSYGAEINANTAKAKQADPTNPRAWFVDAQYWKNVPEAFGGGKATAKKLVEKSLELYKTFKPASPLHPTWGQEEAEKLLASCQ
ncbi:hypothetical protein GWC95_02975 [Sediminibacterium roseum]|uniref:Uncharacterized protein n=1 Tax=Sediminibacterium roseum TaxID=1978412 RepID=A0ABW9ZP53_9BACT|nr:hypothetical protein [Sediminibacterium roseum]NCI48869.1 hypothetical protein [Sediminibacterium roseum]